MRGIDYLAAAVGSLALGGVIGTTSADGLSLSSEAFTHGETIPTRYTCDGRDISPPLTWDGIPSGTRSLALIASDPDAPRGTWYHWVLYAIPPEPSGLPENVDPRERAAAIHDGMNSWKRGGYSGPCPPTGRHRYFFHLYALDRVPEVPQQPSAAELHRAMQGHVISEATLMGLYARHSRQ
ncbi:MAG: YbhB/YbcL family Raf kinase inhibitor-like protein [Nitrococcus mobilis]|nr:YbhB/YbcL family Raf kinase inhibitor-like protein [Nitrococcus mobilis]